METLLAAKCSSEKILPKQKKKGHQIPCLGRWSIKFKNSIVPTITKEHQHHNQKSTINNQHGLHLILIRLEISCEMHCGLAIGEDGREMSGVTIFRGHVDFAGARWYESQKENLCLTSLQRVETSHPWKCLYQNPPKPLWVLSKTSASCKQINPSQFANPSQPYPSRPIWLPWHPERGLERRTPQRRPIQQTLCFHAWVVHASHLPVVSVSK